MKVEIVEVEQKTFPRLRRLKEYPGVIVLFENETTGTVLSSQIGSFHKVGSNYDVWSINCFEDLPEGFKVILSN